MDKTLYLIDGHALIFKMYYAFFRRPMINSKGVDTSILFGFTKYLLELIEKQQPTHLAVAFDPPGGTFRNQIFPEYKANRDATPQLVIDALDPLMRICEAFGIPTLMIKGFEADDVIGSAAKRGEQEGYTVYMVTPDKDYGQLISEHIFQFKPGKSGGDDEIIDPSNLCEKLGINEPHQVIEMLTLCGDTADNVPGVHGVGKVGASKLLAKYGTVENIYRHLDELSAKQQENFKEAEPHIGLSHELVTIKTDIDIDLDLEQTRIGFDQPEKIAAILAEFEFGSLKKHLPELKTQTAPTQEKQFSYELLEPAVICRKATERKKCALLLQTAEEGIFAPIHAVLIGVEENGKAYASKGSLEDFYPLLEDAAIDKYGTDLKKSYNLLIHAGVSLEGHLLDIELMHYLINPEKSHRTDILARAYLNIDLDAETEAPEPVQASLFDDFANDAAEEAETTDDRALREAAALVSLGTAVHQELEQKGLLHLYDEIEEPLISVLARMESAGVKLDLQQLQHFSGELSTELADLQDRIREAAGEPDMNIMSPKQIGTVLFEKLQLDPTVKMKKGAKSYPTDEETLTRLMDRNPIVDDILEYRGVRKLLSTYIEPLPSYISPVSGKIHTTFNQAQTATGRLSSSHPNLQNIPIRTERGKEIRKAFIPSTSDGLILSADYSQIELRIMAHLCQDAHLIEAFKHGLDVHAMTAAKIFKMNLEDVTPDQRRIAKTANFGIMYGISAFGLSQRLKITRQEAKKIIDDYFENFPSISTFIEKTIASTRENGYVETLFGRRRYLPDITARNATVRALAERNAVNAPIQGTSADIIKIAMARIDRKMREKGMRSRMILQIHDELVFDTTPDEAAALQTLVTGEMENVLQLSIPLTVECNYGKNWLEAH